MKTKHIKLVTTLLSGIAFMTMPFQTLQATSTTTTEPDDLPGIGVQPDEYFFTGKPYDEDLGGVIFLYRNYDVETNRWMSSDPSGFPDGPNNQFYAPVPLMALDPLGLFEHQAIDDALNTAVQDAVQMAESNFHGSITGLSQFALGEDYAYMEATISNISVEIEAGANVRAEKKIFGIWIADNNARNANPAYGGSSFGDFGFNAGTYEDGMQSVQNANGSLDIGFTISVTDVTFDPPINVESNVRMLGINNIYGIVDIDFDFDVTFYE